MTKGRAVGPIRERRQSAGRLPGAFWMLWTGTVLNRLGLLLPAFLVLYVVRERLGSPVAAAALVSAQAAGSVAASLIGGVLSDRFGARRTIVCSQLLNCAVAAALAFGPPMVIFAPLIFVTGCLSTIHRPAGAAMIARLAAPSSRARAFGLLYWATNVGSSVGPVLAGFALTLAPHALFLLNAVSAAGYATIASRLPNDAVPREPSTHSRARASLRAAARPFMHRPVGPFLLLSFALAVVYLQRQSALPLDMAAHGLRPDAIGTALAINGLLVVALQPFASPAARRLRLLGSFVLASVLIGAGFGMNALVHSYPGYVAAVCVWTIGEIVLAPVTGTYMAVQAKAGEQGSFQGAYLFVWNLGASAGAPAGVWLLGAIGSGGLWAIAFAVAIATGFGHLWLARSYPYDQPGEPAEAGENELSAEPGSPPVTSTIDSSSRSAAS